MAEAEISNGSGINSFDIHSLFSSERDFLIRNNGDQVKIDSFKGKKFGLYFSASWCGPCRRFTPILTEVYNELSPKGDFEVIFVSGDADDASFDGYFSKMPWLAIPFSDSETRTLLDQVFKVMGIPHLVLLDKSGKVLSNDGVEIIGEYGAEAYPFTEEKIRQMKEEEERAKREQSLKSLLVSNCRDFVVSADGKQIPVSELEGKTVGLYFSVSSYKPCTDFTQKLLEVYQKLKEINGESSCFEIVLISLDDDEESFNRDFGNMPWLTLPCKDKSCKKLARYFELSTLPTLVIIGPNGKTLNSNVSEAIEEHGIEAFPFTLEKIAEIEKAKQNSQTLESVLVSENRDFVIGKDGSQIPVSDLVGKIILLYFSASWCPPCRAFLPKFIEAYEKIKEKDEEIEVIFISSDRDQASFDELYSEMPWLALPFGDPRKASLSRRFQVRGIPKLVAIGKNGRTVTKEARNMIAEHGADAYPFTQERLKEIEKSKEGWICDGEVCHKA